MRNALTGKFRPRNPQKYRGDPTNIIYRSSYELKLFRYMDRHEMVKRWSSEEVVVPYKSPIDGDRWHRYFPDVVAEIVDRDGVVQTIMIEVKPAVWTKAPAVRDKSNHTKTYLREVYQWAQNSSKWEAARAFCAKRGWQFRIFTEKELGIVEGFWGKVKS